MARRCVAGKCHRPSFSLTLGSFGRSAGRPSANHFIGLSPMIAVTPVLHEIISHGGTRWALLEPDAARSALMPKTMQRAAIFREHCWRLMDDRAGPGHAVGIGWSLSTAQPARSAYARFLVFTVRTGLIGKVAFGSNSPVRQALGGCPVVAPSCRSGSERGTAGIRPIEASKTAICNGSFTSIPAVHCVSSRSASSAIRSLSRPYDSPPVRLYRRSAKRQNGRSCDPYEVQS